jgi:hypothetical protein
MDLTVTPCMPHPDLRPLTVGFTAVAGTTYYILAIDDQEDGGGSCRQTTRICPHRPL